MERAIFTAPHAVAPSPWRSRLAASLSHALAVGAAVGALGAAHTAAVVAALAAEVLVGAHVIDAVGGVHARLPECAVRLVAREVALRHRSALAQGHGLAVRALLTACVATHRAAALPLVAHAADGTALRGAGRAGDGAAERSLRVATRLPGTAALPAALVMVQGAAEATLGVAAVCQAAAVGAACVLRDAARNAGCIAALGTGDHCVPLADITTKTTTLAGGGVGAELVLCATCGATGA